MIHDLEVMVLNAASPDPRDYQIIQDNLDVISKFIDYPERIGVYDAWNVMIKASKAPFIANANTDDIVAPDCYHKLIARLERYGPAYGFAYPNWYVMRKACQWPPEGEASGQPGMFTGDITKAGVGHFPLWRRTLHKKHGYFDTSFKALGDVDWWTRCYYGGTNFLWVKEFLAGYYWRDGENLWSKEVNQNEWDLYWAKVEQYKAQNARGN